MVKFVKVRDVKTPDRGTKFSAGMDIFVPNDYDGPKELNPGEDILIPSGLKVIIPKNKALLAVDKSGIASKMKLKIGAKLIDEDFPKEIHIHLYNFSKIPQYIEAGMKLTQFIVVDAHYEEWEEVDEHIQTSHHEYLESTRTDGFGHTGI